MIKISLFKITPMISILHTVIVAGYTSSTRIDKCVVILIYTTIMEHLRYSLGKTNLGEVRLL